jgi:hypothetical protein
MDTAAFFFLMMVAGVAMTLVGFFMWQGAWAALAALGMLLALPAIPLFFISVFSLYGPR